MNGKIYLHGGLNDKNEVVDSMDVFDAMTYKVSEVKYRLDTKCPSR